MILGIGTDLCQISRMGQSIHRFGDKFAQRILTMPEFNHYQQTSQPAAWLAKRFAAKEAASKALGTGMQKISWRDIMITHDALGAPLLSFSGTAAQIADAKGIRTMHLSLSDEGDYALAFVVLSK